MSAVRTGDIIKIKDSIRNGGDPNFQDSSGKAVLHHLCSQEDLIKEQPGEENIWFHLIARGADINRTDINGNTPLFACIQSGNYPGTLALVNHGARVNHRNNDLRTPLFTAVGFVIAGINNIPSMRFVRLLHEAGADIFIHDREGKNLMHASKDPGVTAWLIEHGLSPKLKDKYGKTPLDYSSAEIFRLRDIIAGTNLAKDKFKN